MIKKIYAVLTGLNIAGIFASIYLTYLHYKPSASSICNFNDQWNCDIVNKSIYAEIFGIPVAILGLIAYIAFLIFSIRGLKTKQNELVPYYIGLLSLGVVFTLYLTAIETFVLKTYCVFCVFQQIIILIELGFAIYLYKLTQK